jgi:hypothetical protein
VAAALAVVFAATPMLYADCAKLVAVLISVFCVELIPPSIVILELNQEFKLLIFVFCVTSTP